MEEAPSPSGRPHPPYPHMPGGTQELPGPGPPRIKLKLKPGAAGLHSMSATAAPGPDAHAQPPYVQQPLAGPQLQPVLQRQPGQHPFQSGRGMVRPTPAAGPRSQRSLPQGLGSGMGSFVQPQSQPQEWQQPYRQQQQYKPPMPGPVMDHIGPGTAARPSSTSKAAVKVRLKTEPGGGHLAGPGLGSRGAPVQHAAEQQFLAQHSEQALGFVIPAQLPELAQAPLAAAGVGVGQPVAGTRPKAPVCLRAP
jgi:hypothetical protein